MSLPVGGLSAQSEWEEEAETEAETSSIQIAVDPMDDIDSYVCSYSWPCHEALAVMYCESTGRSYATDGYNDGLFQVARKYHTRRLLPGESLFDPAANVRVAFEIWSEQSWRPWPYCGRNFR